MLLKCAYITFLRNRLVLLPISCHWLSVTRKWEQNWLSDSVPSDSQFAFNPSQIWTSCGPCSALSTAICSHFWFIHSFVRISIIYVRIWHPQGPVDSHKIWPIMNVVVYTNLDFVRTVVSIRHLYLIDMYCNCRSPYSTNNFKWPYSRIVKGPLRRKVKARRQWLNSAEWPLL